MWEYDACDMVQNFIVQDLSLESVSAFMDFFELGSFQLPDRIRSACSLALVYYEKESNFTSDDLAWLSHAPAAAICRGDCDNIIFVELDCDDSEYYIAAAAIIKLLNITFSGDNLYVFKNGNAIAFGGKRFLDDTISDNFCVTKLFDEKKLEECVLFLEEATLSEKELIPLVMSDFSPQEHAASTTEERCWKKNEDYIQMLDEIQESYGVDMTGEYLHYIDESNQSENETVTYEETCSMLRHIGENGEETSYDMLEDASESKAATIQDQGGTAYPIDDTTLNLNYSDEAFSDAEQLLKEMLEHDGLSTEI